MRRIRSPAACRKSTVYLGLITLLPLPSQAVGGEHTTSQAVVKHMTGAGGQFVVTHTTKIADGPPNIGGPAHEVGFFEGTDDRADQLFTYTHGFARFWDPWSAKEVQLPGQHEMPLRGRVAINGAHAAVVPLSSGAVEIIELPGGRTSAWGSHYFVLGLRAARSSSVLAVGGVVPVPHVEATTEFIDTRTLDLKGRVMHGAGSASMHADRYGISADGSTFVFVTGRDEAVQRVTIWDVNASRPRRILDSKGARRRFPTLSSDGKYLALTEGRNSFRVFDSATGESLFHGATIALAGATAPLSFSGDGRLACLTPDGASVWRVSDLKLLSSAELPAGRFGCLAISDDSNLVAGGQSNGGIYVRDLNTGRVLMPGLPAQDELLSAAVSANGELVAIGRKGGTLELRNVQQSAVARTIDLGSRPVSSVRFSPDGTLLVTATRDSAQVAISRDGTIAAETYRGSVTVWPLASQLPSSQFSGASPIAVTERASELLVAYVDDANRVVVRPIRRPGEASTLPGHPSDDRSINREVLAMVFTPGGEALLTAGADGYVRCWDLGTLQQRYAIETGAAYDGEGLSAGGTIGAVACSSRRVIVVFRIADGASVGEIPAAGRVSRVQIGPRGDVIAVNEQDGVFHSRLWLWSPAGVPIADLQAHRATIQDIQFDRNGSMLMSASRDGSVSLWRIARPASPPND